MTCGALFLRLYAPQPFFFVRQSAILIDGNRDKESGRGQTGNMKMLIFVLNRVEKLEPALNKLEHAGLRGATVLSSRGMAMTLDKYCDGSFLGSLRAMMEPDREENRTVFMVLKDEDVERAVAAVEEVAGSFNTPNRFCERHPVRAAPADVMV